MTKTIELKAGGAQIAVTEANKAEFVELAIKQRLVESVHKQLDEIRRGFNDVIPTKHTAVLTGLEFETVLCGVPEGLPCLVPATDGDRVLTDQRERLDEAHQLQWIHQQLARRAILLALRQDAQRAREAKAALLRDVHHASPLWRVLGSRASVQHRA